MASVNQVIRQTRLYRSLKSKIPVGMPLGKQLFFLFAWSVASLFLSSVGIQLFVHHTQQLAWDTIAVAGT